MKQTEVEVENIDYLGMLDRWKLYFVVAGLSMGMFTIGVFIGKGL